MSASSDALKETRWSDSWIRWEKEETDENDDRKGSKQIGENDSSNQDDPDDSEEEEAGFDPFKDPDPTNVFAFSYPHPDDPSSNTIQIDLHGFKMESDQTWNSTGLTLWRSSNFLCQHLVENPDLCRNKRTVELGCGLGLCGILAHRITCPIVEADNDNNQDVVNGSAKDDTEKVVASSRVWLTDGDTDVLPKLRENVARNQSDRYAETVSAHQLIWGTDTAQAFLRHYGEGKPFDVLLASDVVYVKTVVEPLFETVDALMADDGVFVMAYCSRRDVPITIEEVLESATIAGYKYNCVADKEGIHVYVFEKMATKTTTTTKTKTTKEKDQL